MMELLVVQGEEVQQRLAVALGFPVFEDRPLLFEMRPRHRLKSLDQPMDPLLLQSQPLPLIDAKSGFLF